MLHKFVESNLKIWFVGAICLYRKNVVEQLQGLVSVPKWFLPIRPHQIGKAQIKGQGDHERKKKRGSSLNSSQDEVSVHETKQEWLPQKSFNGHKIYQGIKTGTHKTGLRSSTIPPQIFHILSSTNSKALKLTNNQKKKKNPHSAPLNLSYLLTRSLFLSQNAVSMCVKPGRRFERLTRHVPSLWKIRHENNQP